MSQYLLYTTIYNQIADEMGNQAPNSGKILRAVNAELRNLQTKYSLETFRRKVTASIKTDGTAYLISTIIPANDVRGIVSIKINDDDTIFDDLVPVDKDVLINSIKSDRRVNQYSFYYEDGKQYLRVITDDVDTTARNFDIVYDTTKLAVDVSGNFYDEVESGGNLYAMVPDRCLDLISLGAQKRLFYQSIGDTDSAQVSLVRNRYDSELSKLGLDSIAKMPDRNIRKVKIRKPW
jgi:hypothetical protein